MYNYITFFSLHSAQSSGVLATSKRSKILASKDCFQHYIKQTYKPESLPSSLFKIFTLHIRYKTTLVSIFIDR